MLDSSIRTYSLRTLKFSREITEGDYALEYDSNLRSNVWFF